MITYECLLRNGGGDQLIRVNLPAGDLDLPQAGPRHWLTEHDVLADEHVAVRTADVVAIWVAEEQDGEVGAGQSPAVVHGTFAPAPAVAVPPATPSPFSNG